MVSCRSESPAQRCRVLGATVEPRCVRTALMPDSGLSTYNRMQQRLVVARLELVRHHQEAIRVLPNISSMRLLGNR